MQTRQTARGLAPWTIVALGGLVAGAIDITYACAFWAIKAGVLPPRIFQSVAAGVLGRDAAVAGGAATAALGLALHFFIATTVAFVFYAASRYAPSLWRRPWLWGALYGVAVYGAMTYVVVPLSRAASGGKPNVLWITLSILIHAFGIGVPVALAARAASRSRAPAAPPVTVGSPAEV
jgi:hypothetical protein